MTLLSNGHGRRSGIAPAYEESNSVMRLAWIRSTPMDGGKTFKIKIYLILKMILQACFPMPE
jgi:hypothetical protein